MKIEGRIKPKNGVRKLVQKSVELTRGSSECYKAIAPRSLEGIAER